MRLGDRETPIVCRFKHSTQDSWVFYPVFDFPGHDLPRKVIGVKALSFCFYLKSSFVIAEQLADGCAEPVAIATVRGNKRIGGPQQVGCALAVYGHHWTAVVQ